MCVWEGVVQVQGYTHFDLARGSGLDKGRSVLEGAEPLRKVPWE